MTYRHPWKRRALETLASVTLAVWVIVVFVEVIQ